MTSYVRWNPCSHKTPCQTDQFFAPGSILTLFLTIDQAVFKCNASILKPFIPFNTKSQVLLVTASYIRNTIPRNPRGIRPALCRSCTLPLLSRPSLVVVLEIATAEHRKAFSPRTEPFDYIDFEGVLEDFFYRPTEDAFDLELAAYSHLQDLTGKHPSLLCLRKSRC